MENNEEQQTLTPPRIKWIKPTDFLNGKLTAEIVEVRSTPNLKFRGAFDTELILQMPSGIKRSFSLWGDNYDLLFEFCKNNKVKTVGRIITLTIDQKEVNGKIQTCKTITSVQ